MSRDGRSRFGNLIRLRDESNEPDGHAGRQMPGDGRGLVRLVTSSLDTPLTRSRKRPEDLETTSKSTYPLSGARLRFPLRFVFTFRIRLEAGSGLWCDALSVRSMHRDQEGFKSPVNRMNTEEQKKLLAVKRTTRSQLRKGDRPWGGRLWESCQAMNKTLMRGRRDGISGHNATKFHHPVPKVNGAFGQRRSRCLPTEWERSGHGRPDSLQIQPSNLDRRDRSGGRGGRSNALGDVREVSRGHSSWRNELECVEHVKLPEVSLQRRAKPIRWAAPATFSRH